MTCGDICQTTPGRVLSDSVDLSCNKKVLLLVYIYSVWIYLPWQRPKIRQARVCPEKPRCALMTSSWLGMVFAPILAKEVVLGGMTVLSDEFKGSLNYRSTYFALAVVGDGLAPFPYPSPSTLPGLAAVSYARALVSRTCSIHGAFCYAVGRRDAEKI